MSWHNGSSRYANSSYASGSTTTTQARLATPTLNFSVQSTTNIYFYWQNITNAEAYVLKVGSNTYNVSGSSFINTAYTVTGLTPGTSYVVQVKAVDSNGSYLDSYYSSAQTATTKKIAGQFFVDRDVSRPANTSFGYNYTTVPAGVDIVSAVCIGGGGGAGGSGNDLGDANGLASGGGGGGGLSYGSVALSSSSSDRNYIFKIGGGGAGTRSNGESGGDSAIYFVKQIGNTVIRSSDQSQYDVYVDFYQDLINYYNANIASSGTSKYSWGSSHWTTHGKSEGRWLPGNLFLLARGGTGGKLPTPDGGTYQSGTNGIGGTYSFTTNTTAGNQGGPGGLGSENYAGGAGGGAAGYAGGGGGGRFGNQGIQYTNYPAIPTAGSGAGAGGDTDASHCQGGGGVGVFGNSSTATVVGQGGSGGANGEYIGHGGKYGGGGGSDDDDTERAGGNGAAGAIRLVWGESSRHYPNANPDV